MDASQRRAGDRREGKGCTVTDVHGKEYLDLTAGYFVNNAGHCHPRIIEAAHEAARRGAPGLAASTARPAAIRLAKRLIELGPEVGRTRCSSRRAARRRTSSRSRRARQYTKKTDIAYLENGYHGLTLGSLEVTASEKYRESAGKPMGTENYAIPTRVLLPLQVRSAHRVQARSASTASRRKFDARPKTAAIIAEIVQAVGGLAPPQKWWDRLDAIRKKRGILLIADEVQTGLGRTGKMFAIEHYGLEPEIMTGGKGLSGGVGSLAATMASDEICQGVLRRHDADLGRQRGVGRRRPRDDRDDHRREADRERREDGPLLHRGRVGARGPVDRRRPVHRPARRHRARLEPRDHATSSARPRWPR